MVYDSVYAICIFTMYFYNLVISVSTEIILLCIKYKINIISNIIFCIIQDTKIASLERNIRDLEDEIQMLKTNGVLNTEDREEEIKQIEVYKSHSKFMKNKVKSINILTLVK